MVSIPSFLVLTWTAIGVTNPQLSFPPHLRTCQCFRQVLWNGRTWTCPVLCSTLCLGSQGLWTGEILWAGTTHQCPALCPSQFYLKLAFYWVAGQRLPHCWALPLPSLVVQSRSQARQSEAEHQLERLPGREARAARRTAWLWFRIWEGGDGGSSKGRLR